MDDDETSVPEPHVELVAWETVAAFSSSWEAALARARLETEGIPAIVADDHLGSLMSWNLVGGFKVRVAPEEKEEAERLLAAQRPAPEIFLVTDDELAERRCPGCNSDNLREGWRRPSRWLCRSCGKVLADEPEPAAGEDEGNGAADFDDRNGEDLVPVARFFTPWEAHLARTRLESEGIRACVLEERLPPIDLWTGRPQALNRVAVRSRDAREAEALLAAMEEEAGAEGGPEDEAAAD